MALAGAVIAPVTRWRFWLGVAAGFLLLVWLSNDILLAGGSLLGFAGVLIAVPVAAIVGVVARRPLGRYRASNFCRGSVSG